MKCVTILEPSKHMRCLMIRDKVVLDDDDDDDDDDNDDFDDERQMCWTRVVCWMSN